MIYYVFIHTIFEKIVQLEDRITTEVGSLSAFIEKTVWSGKIQSSDTALRETYEI